MKLWFARSGNLEVSMNAVVAFAEKFEGKFVLGFKDDQYLMALGLRSDMKHSYIALNVRGNGYKILGGGSIKVVPASNIIDLEWRSISMRQDFGFDRPKDETILAQVREQIKIELGVNELAP